MIFNCPEELALAVTAAAVAAAKSFTEEELGLLASASIQFADTLNTIIAARAAAADKCKDDAKDDEEGGKG